MLQANPIANTYSNIGIMQWLVKTKVLFQHKKWLTSSNHIKERSSILCLLCVVTLMNVDLSLLVFYLFLERASKICILQSGERGSSICRYHDMLCARTDYYCLSKIYREHKCTACATITRSVYFFMFGRCGSGGRSRFPLIRRLVVWFLAQPVCISKCAWEKIWIAPKGCVSVND